MATELQQVVRDYGDFAPRSSKIAGNIDPNWLDIRSGPCSQDTQAILVEAERGEDYLKLEYQRALQMVLGDRIYSLLSMHYLMLQASYDQVRELRESFQKELK